MDLLSLFKDVASEFVQMATVPSQVRHLVDRAVRIALDQRTVTCIVLPHDLQREPKADRSWREEIEGNVARWWNVLEERAMNEAEPLNPQRVFWGLSPRLPLGHDGLRHALWDRGQVRLP